MATKARQSRSSPHPKGQAEAGPIIRRAAGPITTTIEGHANMAGLVPDRRPGEKAAGGRRRRKLRLMPGPISGAGRSIRAGLGQGIDQHDQITATDHARTRSPRGAEEYYFSRSRLARAHSSATFT